MIRRILPLAFDSFGVRSMATFIETSDARILIDPGAALAPVRHGLGPHFLEWRRLDECWAEIERYAGEADILVVTHYHYDHHDPDHPEIYRDKTVLVKHPTENINLSQSERAATLLRALQGLPKKLEFADRRKIQVGKTTLTFSNAVCHGTNSRLGYVVEVNVRSGDESFLYTSDVEGPALKEQIGFILKEKPDFLFVDGPMTYMMGYRYSHRNLAISIRNLVKAIKKINLNTVVLDHHLLRDLEYRKRMEPVYDAAKDRGVNAMTAAEFCGRKIEMLEARRTELYEKYGEMEVKGKKRLSEE